jgi:hypothetical protein
MRCVWDGCQATFDGDNPPAGWTWTWLILYQSKQPFVNVLDIPPKDVLRDAALCPEHTKRLDEQLKELDRALSGPAIGNA